MCDMGQTMPDMEDDDDGEDGPSIAIVLRAFGKRRMKPGDAAKRPEGDDEDEMKENDDLVNLVQQTRGNSKAPSVLPEDLPVDASRPAKRKKGSK